MNAYTFRIQQPEARRAEVELQVESRGAESLDVRLPVWTPGSYLVREHQRHVDGLRAEGDGRELQVEKVDKQTWRVRTSGARAIRIWYRLHCFELTVRTNHVDGTHAKQWSRYQMRIALASGTGSTASSSPSAPITSTAPTRS